MDVANPAAIQPWAPQPCTLTVHATVNKLVAAEQELYIGYQDVYANMAQFVLSDDFNQVEEVWFTVDYPIRDYQYVFGPMVLLDNMNYTVYTPV